MYVIQNIKVKVMSKTNVFFQINIGGGWIVGPHGSSHFKELQDAIDYAVKVRIKGKEDKVTIEKVTIVTEELFKI